MTMAVENSQISDVKKPVSSKPTGYIWLRGHTTNDFVLRFHRSFQSLEKWLRGLATIKNLH